MNYHKMQELREAAGLTQAQLGEKVLVSQTMIARVETGAREPSLSLLGRIAEALGVAAADLL